MCRRFRRAASNRGPQVYPDRGALAGPGGDFHRAAGLLCEPEHHRKPEPGPLIRPFGGKERLEHSIHKAGLDPLPGVGKRQNDIVARLQIQSLPGDLILVDAGVRRLDGQTAAVRHGVPGIHGEIQQCALQGAAVRFDPPKG